jgi:hypothetical protein
MTLVVGLEAQPLFPFEDLNNRNAGLLEVMLANQLFVSAGHTAAEQTRWAFRVGHPATIGGGATNLRRDTYRGNWSWCCYV